MTKTIRLYFLFYLFITVADLLLIYFNQEELRWVTKPLLIPCLLLVVYHLRKKMVLYRFLFAALLFSWAGDVLLQMKGVFIPGLVSFLLAHVCYILYFTRLNKGSRGLLQLQPLIGLPVLVYIIIFLWQLYPFLDAMKLPVSIYACTIGTMLLMSINTKRKIDSQTSTLFFNGALQFVISDSILAVNLFVVSNIVLSLCVMATYASAQYLLIRGSMLTEQQ